MIENTEKTKTGIVLEGGAMRGMFTGGVLDVMMENGITFDGAAGVSAGAVFGCNLKSKQIGRAIRYNLRFCNEWRYCSIRSLLLTGDMFGTDFCYNKLPYELDIFDMVTFRNNPMEFYAVATDLDTGKAVYHKCKTGGGEDMDWFRASASMPIASRPVKIRDMSLLDGGMSDSIPLRFMEYKGYHKNVVVLTRSYEYIKEKSRLMPVLKAALRKYPNAVKAMETRHIRYNKTVEYIKRKEEKGEIFVIRPAAELNIAPTERDPGELIRVYETGRNIMTGQLDALKEYLSIPHLS